MKLVATLLVLTTLTGCGIFPRTHEELKADYSEHHTICSEENIDEMIRRLTKLSATCHVDISEEKYSKKITPKILEEGATAVVAHEHHYSMYSRWGHQPYTLEIGNSVGIFILVELQETESCNTKLDYFYYGPYWKGAHKDYKAWTEGEGGCRL